MTVLLWIIGLLLVLGGVAILFWLIPGFRSVFHDSETILWSRLQMAFGFLMSVASLVDWGPLVTLVQTGGFTLRQALGLFATLFVQGLVTEILRRLRAPELSQR